MSGTARSAGVDRARAVAAICVIGLHTAAPGRQGDMLQTAVQIGSRWAVPFFFLAAGYMMAEAGTFRVRASEKGLSRLARITVAANLLYWPIAAGWAAVTHQPFWPLPRLLVAGAFFHLWFLHGLIIASLLIRLSAGPSWRAVCLVGAALLLSSYWIVDLGSVRGWIPYDTMVFARVMSGSAYVAIGVALRGVQLPRARVALGVVAAGVAATLLDAALLGVWSGGGARQMFAGVPLLGIGVLMLALADKKPPGPMARLGRRDALTIYLLHPLPVVALIVAARVAPPSVGALLLMWELRTAVVLVGTLALARTLHHLWPAPLRWLNGDWRSAGGLRGSASNARS